MRYRHQHGNLMGYVDICMNLLMCFIALFAFAMLLIKVEENKNPAKAAIETNGKIIIHLTWDNQSPSDVDVWVTTTNPETTVSFRNKEQVNLVLDNDNLGRFSHQIEMSDGTVKESFGNNENVMLKECTNTKVIVNLHLYSYPDRVPVKARVELIKPQPYSVMYVTEKLLDTHGQEVTAFSFDLDENCNVTNIDEVFRPFIYGQMAKEGSLYAPLSTPPGFGGN